MEFRYRSAMIKLNCGAGSRVLMASCCFYVIMTVTGHKHKQLEIYVAFYSYLTAKISVLCATILWSEKYAKLTCGAVIVSWSVLDIVAAGISVPT